MSNVLVVVAHADDETLGCGATLSQLARAGHLVSVATFTDGVSARGETERTPFEALNRREHFAKALDVLGLWDADGYPEVKGTADWFRSEVGHGWSHEGLPDQRLDTSPFVDLARRVRQAFDRYRPTVVYTHSAADLNLDHTLVRRAVCTVVRPGHTDVRALYAMEVPSSTEWGTGPTFAPTRFVQVDEVALLAKLMALAHYKDEVRPAPHPRSAEMLMARASYWGSVAGCEYAEPFEVIRVID